VLFIALDRVWSLVRIQSPRLKKRIDNHMIAKHFLFFCLPIAAAVEHKWNMERFRRAGFVVGVPVAAVVFFVSLQQNASL